MNFGIVRTVVAKELRETLRDRRTLIIMLVVPIFLYPALLIVVEQLALFGQRQLEEAPASVVAQGAGAEALAILRSDSSLIVATGREATPEAVLRGEMDLLLRFDAPGGPEQPRRVELFYDGSRDRSLRARALVAARLDEFADTLLARRLSVRGLPGSFAEPLTVADSSVASAERLGGYALGRFLPMILILMTLLGAFYPAIDLSAGEKERATLETLLTTPVPAREIVAGKFITVTVIALCAAILNLASMLLTFQFAAFQFGGAIDIQFSLPASTILLVVLFLVPLAVLFAAIFLGMALRTQSFKEAQNTLTPVQLASMIPMMLPLIPGIPFSYAVAVVPIGGVALLFRELMSGSAPMGPSLLALGTTIMYAALALRFAASSFGREDVLFGTGAADASASRRKLGERLADWRRGGRTLPRPAESLAFVAVVALLYFYLGITIQIRAGEVGLLVSQVVLLALPALAFAFAGPFDARSTLALRIPSSAGVGAALLVILGGIPVGWFLAWVQGFFLEIPAEFLTALEELVRAESTGELLWLFLLVAVTPAICEELVFRGALLQGLRNGMPMSRAVLLSSAVFGAFHLSTETVIRFLPSAWLGLLLAIVAWRTRSIFPAMMMHMVNNGIIIAFVAWPALGERVVSPDGEPFWPLIPIGILLLLVGVRALPRPDPFE